MARAFCLNALLPRSTSTTLALSSSSTGDMAARVLHRSPAVACEVLPTIYVGRVPARLAHSGAVDAVAPSPRVWGNRTRVYPSSVTLLTGRSRIHPTSAERVGVRRTPLEPGLRPSPQPSPRQERGEAADRVCGASEHTSRTALYRGVSI